MAGAQRLGGPAAGLGPWQSRDLAKPQGNRVRITATPARHGPAGIEPLSGDVIGFMLEFSDRTPPIYITGDTVWFDGVGEVARRFRPGLVLLFAGAARTRGPFNLTMSTNDAIETAHAFPHAAIVPVHCESWAHLTQGAGDLAHPSRHLGLRHNCIRSSREFRRESSPFKPLEQSELFGRRHPSLRGLRRSDCLMALICGCGPVNVAKPLADTDQPEARPVAPSPQSGNPQRRRQVGGFCERRGRYVRR
jgi:hypothetical protein